MQRAYTTLLTSVASVWNGAGRGSGCSVIGNTDSLTFLPSSVRSGVYLKSGFSAVFAPKDVQVALLAHGGHARCSSHFVGAGLT